MTRPVDQANVLRLYEELGVQPEDGVQRLTERYRQRVRELHPDSDTARIPQVGAADRGDGLGWLTRSYREAIAFDRIHGRLPGAGAASPRRSGEAPAPSSTRTAAGAQRPGIRGRVGRKRGRRSQPGNGWRWLVAIITIVAVLLATMPELLEMRVSNPFREPATPPAGERPRSP
jgi:hypothetical protein